MDTYTITDVKEYRPDRETPCWMIVMERPDGSTHLHVFPKNAVDWRMAEYDVDAETALDMILHEPFAARLREPGEVPALFTADSVQVARDSHLTLLERAKQEVAKAVVPPQKTRAADPLDVIRQWPRASGQEIAAMRRSVLAERTRHAKAAKETRHA
jgi:hypothetical protein